MPPVALLLPESVSTISWEGELEARFDEARVCGVRPIWVAAIRRREFRLNGSKGTRTNGAFGVRSRIRIKSAVAVLRHSALNRIVDNL